MGEQLHRHDVAVHGAVPQDHAGDQDVAAG